MGLTRRKTDVQIWINKVDVMNKTIKQQKMEVMREALTTFPRPAN